MYYLEQGMKSALLKQERLQQTSSLLYSFQKLGSYSTCVFQNSFAHSQVMSGCPTRWHGDSIGKSQLPICQYSVYWF
jgi:hypothetical protein